MNFPRSWLAMLPAITALAGLPGQAAIHVLRGVVTSLQGTGIGGANGLLLESLDGCAREQSSCPSTRRAS